MKFVLLVEGYTEQKAIPAFLKRWLDVRLNQRVGVQIVRFDGWPELISDLPDRAQMYLESPKAAEIIAVIALLDLYGPSIYPNHLESADQRLLWATKELESRVGRERFKVFFAVHEVEAWLLSNSELFPTVIRKALPAKITYPETVNFDEPPGKLLDRLYKDRLRRKYKKLTDGKDLFDQLDPQTVYNKCPYFRQMMDTMLQLAKDAGQ
ncbi:MAG: DUF4276 family protein [Anaerolineae bacterium]|uniref:DUF4276 family protein n=1 Tax=Candidatus Amarolinea dominans TaxID=3140696 RepID=UPI001E0E01D5|nr:DUF4276 family protein [Anaerolineae bacterium]MBK7203901.1 DUF4276 family protein [Anaerolineae bacterium]MBK9092287.1 DUF4276 family protein [Anaerolineae bacterium]